MLRFLSGGIFIERGPAMSAQLLASAPLLLAARPAILSM